MSKRKRLSKSAIVGVIKYDYLVRRCESIDARIDAVGEQVHVAAKERDVLASVLEGGTDACIRINRTQADIENSVKELDIVLGWLMRRTDYLLDLLEQYEELAATVFVTLPGEGGDSKLWYKDLEIKLETLLSISEEAKKSEDTLLLNAIRHRLGEGDFV